MIKNLTREQAIKEHRKMWNWIADETLKRERKVYKEEYFEHFENRYPERPIYDCWCCEYANRCDKCPVAWGEDGIACGSSIYKTWFELDNHYFKAAANLARLIAELPEK